MSSIFRGKIWHHRKSPVDHSFCFPTLFLYGDVDNFKYDGHRLRLFSWNRFGFLSFREGDFLDESAQAPSRRVRFQLRRHGIDFRDGRIFLMSVPRFFGFGFSPVNFWFCEDRWGVLQAIVMEMNSLRGERHVYVLDARQGRVSNFGYQFQIPREFQFSPFSEVKGDYLLSLELTEQRLQLRLGAQEDEEESFAVGMDLERLVLADKTIVTTMLQIPFSLAFMSLRILWEFAWLRFVKKMPFSVHTRSYSSDTLGGSRLPWLLRSFRVNKHSGITGRNPVLRGLD